LPFQGSWRRPAAPLSCLVRFRVRVRDWVKGWVVVEARVVVVVVVVVVVGAGVTVRVRIGVRVVRLNSPSRAQMAGEQWRLHGSLRS
jgi:hypothetical protein